ncbi:ribokinase [Luteococcus sanguinis]|uniref:Ribokinase n=1 Tax=Luteococcus sanguinis TaxID=174038 RepID=A0ABW1WWE8_9ACTN
MAASSIVVLGSANTDLVVQLDRRPGPGETVLGGDLAVLPGGKGANQAVAAARSGGSVVFLGAVGQDGNGDLLLESMGAAGVDVSQVARVERPTGTAMIQVTPEGENSIVVSPGANTELTSDFADRFTDIWGAAAVLVFNFECLPATVEHVATKAAEKGVRVVLNAAPAFEIEPGLLAVADPLVVNETEAVIVAGREGAPGASADPVELAERLVGRGARSVVVTLGAAGCVLAGAGVTARVPAYVVNAVDTTGAGDAFVGALACELSRGRSLEEAVRFATATSAVSVQSLGAQSSYHPRAEVEAFISSHC